MLREQSKRVVGCGSEPMIAIAMISCARVSPIDYKPVVSQGWRWGRKIGVPNQEVQCEFRWGDFERAQFVRFVANCKASEFYTCHLIGP